MEVRKGYKKTEMGIVPEDWLVEPFQNFFSFISYGFTNPMPTVQSGIYMVTAKDINNGKLQFDTARFTTEEAYRTLLTDKSRPKKGDLLLTKDGALGRVALVDDRVICINQSVAIIRLNNKAVPEFIKVLLESPVYQQRMLEDAGGTTIKHIYITIVDKMPIVLPPTHAEQEAIAEALSDADTLIESLETLLAKKRQVKQGVMSELLSGERRLPGFSGEWSEKKLGDLVILSKAGVNPASSPETLFAHFSLPAFDAGAMPVLENGDQIGSNKFLVPENAVMISKLNPRIPRIWAPTYIPDNAVCSTEFLVLIPRENVNRNFLAVLCWSPIVSYQMELHAIGTTGSHQRINPLQALAIEVKVPSTLAEQTAIAEILSDMDAEIRAVEEKLSKARAVKAGMMSELLTGRVRLV